MAAKALSGSTGTSTAMPVLDSSLATHQVMAATIVHKTWVDCIAVVAIASITSLADTLALQERDISFLETYHSILICYPKEV